MFESEQLQILQTIVNKNIKIDRQLSENLNLDIDTVRVVLYELEESGFIKLVKHEQHQNPNISKIDLVLVKEITSKGRLVSKEEIPLSTDSPTNSSININMTQHNELSSIYIQILEYINSVSSRQEDDISEISIARNFDLEKDEAHYYLKELEKYNLIKGHQELDMCGYQRYVNLELETEGKIYLKNPDNILDKNLPIEKRTININKGNYNEHIEGNYINQSHTGTGDNIAGDKNITNNYESPELAQILNEIKIIVAELEEEYNPNKEKGQKIIAQKTIDRINNNPNLVKKFISTFDKGSIAYLQAKFISPVQSALIAAIEEWNQNKQ